MNHELGLFVPEPDEDPGSPEFISMFHSSHSSSFFSFQTSNFIFLKFADSGLHRQKSFSVRPAPLQRCNSSENATSKRTVKMRKEGKLSSPSPDLPFSLCPRRGSGRCCPSENSRRILWAVIGEEPSALLPTASTDSSRKREAADRRNYRRRGCNPGEVSYLPGRDGNSL